MRIVVPKLQSSILRVTRRDILLVQCIVPNNPVSPQKPQNDMIYHIAKEHSAPKPDVTFKCKLCYQEFPGFYALRQHRNTQHDMQIGSKTRDVYVEHMVGDVEDHRLREKLRSCQHFLVDSELERARHKVFNYAVKTFNETIVNEQFDLFFTKLKCGAKVNLASVSFLKKRNMKDSDTFTHTKTIPCWIDPNLCARKTNGKSERFSH